MNATELVRYRRTQIETASPLELVVMLYDGAIEQCRIAREAVLTKQFASKSRAVDKTLAILGELQGSLDMDQGGELARSLGALYTYMCEQVVEGSVRLEAGPFEDVERLLATLRSGWHEIATRRLTVTPPPPVGAETSRARLSVTT
jgi:flagellar protein FliS